MDEEQKLGLETPLLPESPHGVVDSIKGIKKDEFFTEVKRQVRLAGPIISVNLLTFLMQVISVMFVGHLGELALSGASMATSFAAVTGFSIMVILFSLILQFYHKICH